MNEFEEITEGYKIPWTIAFAMMLFGMAIGAIGIFFALNFWAGFLRAVNCP